MSGESTSTGRSSNARRLKWHHRRHKSPEYETEWYEAALSTADRWCHLDQDAEARLLKNARTLDASTFWEGLNGITITPHMRAVVATEAAMLTVNIGLGNLRDVTSILLAPTSANVVVRHADGPIISESTACVLGESMLHGPLRLSWDVVEKQRASGSSSSVVLHEFAHKIDMADGAADGTPPGQRAWAAEFSQVMIETLDRLRDTGAEQPLRAYAATNAQELFATATEAFFLQPQLLSTAYPTIHKALREFYNQLPEVRIG